MSSGRWAWRGEGDLYGSDLVLEEGAGRIWADGWGSLGSVLLVLSRGRRKEWNGRRRGGRRTREDGGEVVWWRRRAAPGAMSGRPPSLHQPLSSSSRPAAAKVYRSRPRSPVTRSMMGVVYGWATFRHGLNSGDSLLHLK